MHAELPEQLVYGGKIENTSIVSNIHFIEIKMVKLCKMPSHDILVINIIVSITVKLYVSYRMCRYNVHKSSYSTSIISQIAHSQGKHKLNAGDYSQLKVALHEIILNANYVDTKNKRFAQNAAASSKDIYSELEIKVHIILSHNNIYPCLRLNNPIL